MPNIQSPLVNVLHAGRFGTTSCAGVTLSQRNLAGLVQIAGWSNFDSEIVPHVRKMGFKNAGIFSTALVHKTLTLFRTAPDRLLVEGLEFSQLSESILAQVSLPVLDIGHSRLWIEVRGEKSEDIMARLAPIDFRISALPVGGFVQTGIHKVGVLINRVEENQFDILVPVTWAQSIWEVICLNATPFGYEVDIKT